MPLVFSLDPLQDLRFKKALLSLNLFKEHFTGRQRNASCQIKSKSKSNSRFEIWESWFKESASSSNPQFLLKILLGQTSHFSPPWVPETSRTTGEWIKWWFLHVMNTRDDGNIFTVNRITDKLYNTFPTSSSGCLYFRSLVCLQFCYWSLSNGRVFLKFSLLIFWGALCLSRVKWVREVVVGRACRWLAGANHAGKAEA